MLRKTTLCFLFRNKEDLAFQSVLLGMKKRGFGKGKWNGIGGKVEPGESLKQATVREVEEEIGVKIDELDLKPAGSFSFVFIDSPEWDQHMYAYYAEKWKGHPKETDEMRPEWFDEPPYEHMWGADYHWLPSMLKGKYVDGAFVFNKKGEIVDMKVSFLDEDEI